MEKNEGYSVIEEREELMVVPNTDYQPTLRKAHFLKPILNPKIQSFPQFVPPKQPLNPNSKLINKRVQIRGMLTPLNSWKSWVDSLQKTHEKLWKKVGIFNAIKASTYHIIKEDKLIIELGEKWCCETNSFMFPWGECSITLEDVMILGGFSVLGKCAKNQSKIIEDEDNIMNRLFESRKEIQKNGKPSRCTQKKWLDYFIGSGGELEHVALIVLWLCRYVFVAYSFINSNSFSIAISLARGIRIEFASVILALVYRDLRLLKEKIVDMVEGKDDGSNLLLYAPLGLVQVWAWERFTRLCPKAGALAYGEPRVARWQGVKGLITGDSRVGFECAGDDFLWRPYALKLENWEFASFYSDHEKCVVVDCEDEQLVSFAKCLMTCELVGVDCVEKYFPHRVARQFALDQDIPLLNATLSDVSEPYGMKLYLPPRLYEADVSLRYLKWWRTLLFVGDDTDDCENRNKRTKRLKKVFEIHGDDQEETDKEAAGLESVGNNSELVHKNPSYFEAGALGEDTVMNLQVGVEDAGKCEYIVMEEAEETKMNCSYDNICQRSKIFESQNYEFAVNEIRSPGSNNSVTGLKKYTKTRVNNVAEINENEQGEVREAAKLKEVRSSVGDPVNISDDESTEAVEATEAQGCTFEARINRLERVVSALLGAKVKSKAS